VDLRHRQLHIALVAGELETILLVRAFRMVLLLSGDDNQIALMQPWGTRDIAETWND
jgi:hypothetical protein